MQIVTAVLPIVVLSVLLGSSSGARAADTFVLMVNTTNGAAVIRSDYPSTVWINQYSISSADGSLRPGTWNSLHDQNVTVANWDETSATTTLLSEATVSGQTSFQNGTGHNIGAPFNPTASQDLVFHYRLAGSTTPIPGVVSYLTSFTLPPLPVHEPMPCYGDIDGSGAVSVPDLLLIINGWGSCSPPPGTCPADIAPPNGGDGNVSVPDLLGVINNWGACD